MTVLYSEIRDEIKTGDLIATDSRVIDSFFGFVLFLYQKILKAKFTHVGIAVRMGGRVFLVEATPPEVRLVPLTMIGNFYLIKTDIKKNQQGHSKFLFETLGKKYSLFDLLRSTLRISGSNSDYYCSELAFEFYNNFGYVTDEDAGQTPDDIVEAIIAKSGSTPIKVILDKGNLK